jgi:hypothetical protein
LLEENEPDITRARPASRLGLARVWLFCAVVAVGVGGLLVAGLPYPPWQPPPSANHRISTPIAAPSPVPAARAAEASGGSYAIVAWRDGDGVLRRAGIDAARFGEFTATARGQIEADRRSLALARRNRLRTELAPLFEQMDERVSGYADWVFDWWTSWILLARTFGWVWQDLTTGPVLSLPDRVQAQLVAAVQEQFIGRVVEPRAVKPKIDAVLHGALVGMREDLLGVCAKYQQSLTDLIRREARQVERAGPAQGWVPDPSWQRDGAVLQPLCDPSGGIDEATLRAQFPVLLELNAADSPVNEVILRMARPFATKLISFVVLPVVVAAILGGILLPLFGQLPGVLANLVTGALTGAVGALLIGLAASASVDWLLNRTDATLNRAGFEAGVRKAVMAAEHDFEGRVLDAQAAAVDRQMAALARAMAGKIAAP